MLKTRFFGPGFNPLRVPLRAGVNAGTAFSATAVRGIKYTGGRYYIWGVTSSGAAFIATSLDLLTWSGYTSSNATFYDVSSSGSVVVIVGTTTSFGNTIWTVNPTLSVGSINSYYPASLSEPRYVEWCSGFSKFIISAYSNRAYSNDATGATWTVANYTGTAGYRPGSIIYSPETGAYYDIRISGSTAEYEIYYGATAAANSSLYGGGNVSLASINIRKLSYRAGPSGSHQLGVFSQVQFSPPAGTSILSVDVWNLSGMSLYATLTVQPTTMTELVGAAYFPSQCTYIGRSQTGQLGAIKLVNPSTSSYSIPYNTGNLLSTTGVSAPQVLISAPAGLVTVEPSGQIYTNP